MALLFTNNGQSVLASGVSSSATSMAVTSGHGARFPLPSGGNTFRATLVRASDGGIEVVDVTARSTDTMTVVRGQEGTTGLALAAGDKFELRITATYLNANTGDETGARIAALHHAASAKSALVDADEVTGGDSAAGFGLIRTTWADVKAFLKTYFDTLYQAAATYVTPTTLNNGSLPASVTTLAATDLTTTGNTVLGDATTDTLNVGNGGIVKDANGNVGIGVTPTGRLSVAGSINIASDNTGVLGIGRYSAVYGGGAIDFQGGATFGSFQFGGVEKARIDSSGNVLAVSATGGLGYGTGAGGTATQATSRTTGVTLNKPTGKITLFSTTRTAGTSASFTLTNTLIAATGVVIVNFASATSADKYNLFVTAVAAGSCRIQVYNIAAVAVAEAPVINFCVLKGEVA